MRTTPVVAGVTPCCGNIFRTSTDAIAKASRALDSGICPDCGLDMSDMISMHRGKKNRQAAQRWFHENAVVFNGRFVWNANAAFVAFVEIHDCE